MRKLDIAYINGKVYTVDQKFSTATAFGISDDRFAIVGTDQEVLAHCTPDTPVVDLKGQDVLLEINIGGEASKSGFSPKSISPIFIQSAKVIIIVSSCKTNAVFVF